jgi:hypothetical protein
MRVALSCLLWLAALTGCASRYSIERALLSEYMGDCTDARAVDSGKKDCDGYPIWELLCGGKVVSRQAIWCHKGRCFTEQMAGRCWK